MRQAFPEHVVELQGTADESWLGEVEEGVRSRLAGLAGAGLAFERSPDPERPGLDDDSEMPAQETGERVRSYRLFFVAPTASWARFDVEEERPVDLGEEPPGKGNGERLVRVKGRLPPTLPVFLVVAPWAFSQPAISTGVAPAAALSKIWWTTSHSAVSLRQTCVS